MVRMGSRGGESVMDGRPGVSTDWRCWACWSCWSVDGRAELPRVVAAAAATAAAVAESRSADGRADAMADGATDGGITAVWKKGFRCHFILGSRLIVSDVFSFLSPLLFLGSDFPLPLLLRLLGLSSQRVRRGPVASGCCLVRSTLLSERTRTKTLEKRARECKDVSSKRKQRQSRG